MSFPSWNRTPRIIFTARYDLQSVIIIYTYFLNTTLSSTADLSFGAKDWIWIVALWNKKIKQKTTFTLTDGDLIDANNSDELDLLDYMH